MLLKHKDVMGKINLEEIPKPSFPTLATVKIKETIRLKFDDIFIEDDYNNTIKINGQDMSHVEDLRLSFSEGVDLNQEPPCVIKRKTENSSYELVYGFGRSLALLELGVKEWYFTEIEADEDSIDDVRAIENEPLPKLNNSEQQLKRFLAKKVEKKLLKNTEDALRKKLNEVAPHRKKQSKDRIISFAMEDIGTPQKYAFYNQSKFNLWLKNNCSNTYSTGKLDEDRDMYGYLVKAGYQYRFVMNAIKHFAKTGKHSYCIAHVGAPSENNSIPQQRAKFRKELGSLLENLKTCGMKSDFIHIEGALPQEHGIDNWKQLVQF
tara:strand:+ start:155 stop:1117 length:963 start_codon:yes stop_codon:yes gene_type:complete